MPSPNLSRLDQPLGPLRDKFTQDISSEDYERKEGFLCQAAAAGSLTYRTLHGIADQTETVALGDVISLGSIPITLRAVRTGGIASVVVGLV